MKTTFSEQRPVENRYETDGECVWAPRWRAEDGPLESFLFDQGGSTPPFLRAHHCPFRGKVDLQALATTARIAWEPGALHFGFCGQGPVPKSTFRGRKHPLHQQDTVEVFLDVSRDGLEYVEVQASAYGALTEVYHSWQVAPAFSEAEIERSQLRHHSMDRLFELPGLETHTNFLREEGDSRRARWRTWITVPVAKLRSRRRMPERLEKGDEVRAHLVRYHYLPDEVGDLSLIHLGWKRTTHGSPHVTPMAMGTIRCV